MKVLVAITDYNIQDTPWIHHVLQNYYEISENVDYWSGDYKHKFEIDIVIYNIHPINTDSVKFDSIYQRGLNVYQVPHHENTGENLTWAHRVDFANKINDYDIFIYQECDLIFTYPMLKMFVEHSSRLTPNWIIGLLPYEQCSFDNSLRLPSHRKDFRAIDKYVTLNDIDYFVSFNRHQGSYIATRENLKLAALGSNPRDMGHYGRRETAATEIYLGKLCKIIPINDIEKCLLHHIPNKYCSGEIGLSYFSLEELKRKLQVREIS